MLSQIVGQVGELRNIVSSIAASAEAQAAGISEVNTAIAQLEQVTQQNAAMAKEATAAARQLAKEGCQLLRLISHFSTNGGDTLSATTTLQRDEPNVEMPMRVEAHFVSWPPVDKGGVGGGLEGVLWICELSAVAAFLAAPSALVMDSNVKIAVRVRRQSPAGTDHE